MNLDKPVSIRINEKTYSILEIVSDEKDWTVSQAARNFINSYIEEHNLTQLLTS